ncbi:MAG: hypothetical protein J0M29_22210 [Chitinophagales bacterium]|nr:hypothetical protein [Chitinophagales bacterium]
MKITLSLAFLFSFIQTKTFGQSGIFDSAHRDSLMFDSYAFQVKNDTMYFFTEKEFLNFTGFGKTLFLSYPQHSPEKSINSTPKILTTDTTNR